MEVESAYSELHVFMLCELVNCGDYTFVRQSLWSWEQSHVSIQRFVVCFWDPSHPSPLMTPPLGRHCLLSHSLSRLGCIFQWILLHGNIDYVVLFLTSFTQDHYFDIHPCCMFDYFISFKHQVVLHSRDIPNFIYSLHLMMRLWVFSNFLLSWIKLLWTSIFIRRLWLLPMVNVCSNF